MDVRAEDAVRLRPLLACADDLGVDAGNDACILRLLDAGRLSGASILVDGPNAAAAATAAPQRRWLGLHLNLTESFGQPFAVRPVGRWLFDAWRGHLSSDATVRARLRAEIDRQLQRFGQIAARLPDYVDGHEHVHGLPGVAELLAERLAIAGGAAIPVRSVRATRYRGAKAALISRLCSARAAAPPLNEDFLGVYRFDSARPYAERVERWLSGAGPRPLLMCHPGCPEGALPHRAARAAEHDFLAGSRWPDLLQRLGLRLGPTDA